MRQFTLVLFFALSIHAAQPGELMHSWESSTKSIKAEARFTTPHANRKIYLIEPSKPESTEVLCEFERDAEIIFSPDDSWIALNDFVGSSESTIRLFKRVSGLKYQESKIHPDSKSWDLLSHYHRVPYPKTLIHSYAQVVQWAADSSAVLICLSGHNDIKSHVDNWLCVFDLRLNKASLDLACMNRGSVIFHAR